MNYSPLTDAVADALCIKRHGIPLTSIQLTGNERQALRDDANAALNAIDDAGYALYHKGAHVTAR
jgi:hypothetical protein